MPPHQLFGQTIVIERMSEMPGFINISQNNEVIRLEEKMIYTILSLNDCSTYIQERRKKRKTCKRGPISMNIDTFLFMFYLHPKLFI